MIIAVRAASPGVYSKMWAALPGGYGDIYAAQTNKIGYNAGAIGVAMYGGVGVMRGMSNGGMRIEMGNWKQNGKWFFPQGTRGPHFHYGAGTGLQSHHLPWQAGNWLRNFKGLLGRGDAAADLKNIGNITGGATIAVSGVAAVGGRSCE